MAISQNDAITAVSGQKTIAFLLNHSLDDKTATLHENSFRFLVICGNDLKDWRQMRESAIQDSVRMLPIVTKTYLRACQEC